ncbi:MAG: hypothetical protein IJC48_03215 [Clostridia bacterium]|nr:hypothetical protein [Clostridia bacterium]MBQ4157754.1 hypothetical protein [Clostridia bacterium]
MRNRKGHDGIRLHFLRSEYTFSVDYKNFKITEFSYTNSTVTNFDLAFKDSAALHENKPEPEAIRFARVPLTTPALISVWLDISLVVTFEGEVTIETSVSTSEKFTWKNGSKPTTTKTRTVDGFATDAAVSVKGELKCALTVNLGFSGTGFNVDVAELSVFIGIEAKIKFLSSETDCKDIDVDGTFTVAVKRGCCTTAPRKKQSFQPLGRWKKALFCCRINLL